MLSLTASDCRGSRIGLCCHTSKQPPKNRYASTHQRHSELITGSAKTTRSKVLYHMFFYPQPKRRTAGGHRLEAACGLCVWETSRAVLLWVVSSPSLCAGTGLDAGCRTRRPHLAACGTCRWHPRRRVLHDGHLVYWRSRCGHPSTLVTHHSHPCRRPFHDGHLVCWLPYPSTHLRRRLLHDGHAPCAGTGPGCRIVPCTAWHPGVVPRYDLEHDHNADAPKESPEHLAKQRLPTALPDTRVVVC
jgi:hypothetical protein